MNENQQNTEENLDKQDQGTDLTKADGPDNASDNQESGDDTDGQESGDATDGDEKPEANGDGNDGLDKSDVIEGEVVQDSQADNAAQPDTDAQSDAAAPAADATAQGEKEYVPPTQTSLSQDTASNAPVDPLAPSVTAPSPTAPVPSTDPLSPNVIDPQGDGSSLQEPKDAIGIKSMVNVKGTAATAIIVERITRHMDLLASRVSHASEVKRLEEQKGFIETIGNTLRLPYEHYALVTNQLLTAIKNDSKVFEDGNAFRFMRGLERSVPKDYLDAYRAYMQFLATIAINWSARSRLEKKVCIASVISFFGDRVMKENATRYFREVVAS